MDTSVDLSQSFGPKRQRELFFRGLAGETPDVPIDYDDLKRKAPETMDSGAYGYVAGSAGREETASRNVSSFSEWQLQPRVLKGIDERSLSTSLLGRTQPSPLILAPVGVQSIIHPDGARASARAARALNVPFVHSTVSSYSIEDISDVSGNGDLWFQLYWSDLPDLNRSLIERAEESGYEAIVVTLDTPLMGWRPRDLEQGYFPFLDGEGLANYTSDPVFRGKVDKPPEETIDPAIELFIDVFSNPSADWEELEALHEHTDLPFLIKGVLHPDDVTQAKQIGLDGVIVSNHGGRQIDGEIPSLEALEEISRMDYGDLTILFDSGIRSGSDVLKSYALGADGVLLGRPYLYGLAIDGSDGVQEVLKNIHAELDISMGLCGYDEINDVDRDVLQSAD